MDNNAKVLMLYDMVQKEQGDLQRQSNVCPQSFHKAQCLLAKYMVEKGI